MIFELFNEVFYQYYLRKSWKLELVKEELTESLK